MRRWPRLRRCQEPGRGSRLRQIPDFCATAGWQIENPAMRSRSQTTLHRDFARESAQRFQIVAARRIWRLRRAYHPFEIPVPHARDGRPFLQRVRRGTFRDERESTSCERNERHNSWRSICVLEYATDGRDHLTKLREFRSELLASGGGQGVITCAAVGFCPFPFGFHPSLKEQALQSGIERTFFDGENVLRQSFDGEGNSVAVLRSACERLEDQHVESSGHEVRFFPHRVQYIDYLWIECQWRIKFFFGAGESRGGIPF